MGSFVGSWDLDVMQIMTGADKAACAGGDAAAVFALTTLPAKAPVRRTSGSCRRAANCDMMTQMAPMLEMMKAKMGKRRFGMMMQTMGPMMGQMMEGGGGISGGMIGRADGSDIVQLGTRPDGAAMRRQLSA